MKLTKQEFLKLAINYKSDKKAKEKSQSCGVYDYFKYKHCKLNKLVGKW